MNILGCDTVKRSAVNMNHQIQEYHGIALSPPPPSTLQECSIYRLDQLSKIKSFPFQHTENMTLSSTTDTIAELQKLTTKHPPSKITTILDVTTVACGRDYKSALAISKTLKGVNVIIGTSPCSSTPKVSSSTTPTPAEEEHPDKIIAPSTKMKDVETSQVDIEFMEKELLYGIDDSCIDPTVKTDDDGVKEDGSTNKVKAGFIGQIKISSKFRPPELRELKACAVVQATTKAPLLVAEATPTKHALQILDAIQSCGGILSKTILGHMDMYTSEAEQSKNYDFIKQTLDRGVTICFDRYSLGSGGILFDPNQIFPSVKNVVDCIWHLLQENPTYICQLVLSPGIVMKLQFEKYGGVGYKILQEYLLPRLRAKGVTEEQIDTMLVENPQKLLAWWKQPPPPVKAKEYVPCDICHKMFEPILGTYYTKYTFTYCDTKCLRKHRLNGFKDPPKRPQTAS